MIFRIRKIFILLSSISVRTDNDDDDLYKWELSTVKENRNIAMFLCYIRVFNNN
jgi:hypothetical protein